MIPGQIYVIIAANMSQVIKIRRDFSSVISHIRGYNPYISHYRQSHAPNHLYVLPEYTISSMHKDYCEKFPHSLVSCSYYQRKVRSLNISFVKLEEEECESCELHSIHLKDVHLLKYADHHIVNPDGKRKKKTFTECNKKKKKLYGPFLWMGFNCLKARATSRRQFTFYH